MGKLLIKHACGRSLNTGYYGRNEAFSTRKTKHSYLVNYRNPLLGAERGYPKSNPRLIARKIPV